MYNSLADMYVDNLRKSGYTGTIRTYTPISNTHGNHSELHKAEIEAIASEVVDQKLNALLPEIASAAFSAAYQ